MFGRDQDPLTRALKEIKRDGIRQARTAETRDESEDGSAQAHFAADALRALRGKNRDVS